MNIKIEEIRKIREPILRIKYLSNGVSRKSEENKNWKEIIKE